MILKFTVQELELLITLVSDQLFRREFIDPKVPTYKSKSAETDLGKALVARLQRIVDQDSPKRAPLHTRVTAVALRYRSKAAG